MAVLTGQVTYTYAAFHFYRLRAFVCVWVGESVTLMHPNAKMRDEVLKLLDQRKQIESQLAKHQDSLKSHHVTMSTELLDSEGFPRSDLDIPTIRASRQQIRMLLHDRELVNERIEQLLPLALKCNEAHASSPSPSEQSVQQVSSRLRDQSLLLAVRSVRPQSPASKAVRIFG